ncbi:MAG: chemotaxis protein [Bradyrhizobium sp.]|nr:chemotaxis protein [Bradyrhizobium sp.]
MSAGQHGTGSAIAAIEDVSSRIEDIFAKAGQQLGRGHAIFMELNQALTELSGELSGAQFEHASQALHDIADRLNGLAEALPAESVLLACLGKAATGASELLKPLFKHIQMISIIARSARIEAASLAEDREGFLAFTAEAFELAKAVQASLEGCARDQDLLAKAVEVALGRQKDFDLHYRDRLSSAGGDLISAYSGIQDQRSKSAHLANLAGLSTRKIADTVGQAIISLQAGDSTRQRLEHVCHGLNLAGDAAASLMPRAQDGSADVICRLQAMQLKDAQRQLDLGVGQITQSLSAILSDATGVVEQGRSLYGGRQGELGSGQRSDSSSFLERIKDMLAQASALIATCEASGKAVDGALTLVEDTLARFRGAISGLSEAVIDITLIGMNASLKASHLGGKGNAFVVIANELKAAADQVSAGSGRLKPVLDQIEKSANDLRALRVHGDPAQLTRLEPTILEALHEIEEGNDHLAGLISRLVAEGAEFEGLMNSSRSLMSGLGKDAEILPDVARRLDRTGTVTPNSPLGAGDQTILDGLFARYTMERERDVHRAFLREFGPAPKEKLMAAAPADDGLELF